MVIRSKKWIVIVTVLLTCCFVRSLGMGLAENTRLFEVHVGNDVVQYTEEQLKETDSFGGIVKEPMLLDTYRDFIDENKNLLLSVATILLQVHNSESITKPIILTYSSGRYQPISQGHLVTENLFNQLSDICISHVAHYIPVIVCHTADVEFRKSFVIEKNDGTLELATYVICISLSPLYGIEEPNLSNAQCWNHESELGYIYSWIDDDYE